MKKCVTRKIFEKEFEPYCKEGTQIWVVTRVNKLPIEITKVAISLSELEFINYVRICDETLSASSENYPKRPKVPITTMNHISAVGIQILYNTKYKYIDFFDINSPIKGNGSKMVDAVLSRLPNDWNPSVLMDWSNGFWDKMKQKHNEFEWLMR
jgi:hypothetical protein